MRRAVNADRIAILDTISRAFFDDPVWSWVFPDDEQRRDVYPRFWDFFLTTGLRNQSVDVVEDGAAVTIWACPGVAELATDEEAALVEFLRPVCADRIDIVLEVFARFERARPTSEPHWYLSVVATNPGHAGKRFGVGLIAHRLRTADAEHVPAYLESSNPANLARYRKLGFEPRDEFALPGNGPVVTTMWRAAR